MTRARAWLPVARSLSHYEKPRRSSGCPGRLSYRYILRGLPLPVLPPTGRAQRLLGASRTPILADPDEPWHLTPNWSAGYLSSGRRPGLLGILAALPPSGLQRMLPPHAKTRGGSWAAWTDRHGQGHTEAAWSPAARWQSPSSRLVPRRIVSRPGRNLAALSLHLAGSGPSPEPFFPLPGAYAPRTENRLSARLVFRRGKTGGRWRRHPVSFHLSI